MKKLFILLGLLMFSILGCSCKKGDELNYKISDLSEYLNNYAKNTNYSGCWEMLPAVDLENLPNILESRSAYFVSIGEKTRDYYICGYVSKDIEKDLKEALDSYICHPCAEWLLGRESYFARWTIADMKYFDGNKYPIIWYEIPKDENIPFETKKLTLAIVVETVGMTYTSLDGSVKFQGEFLYENKKFYDENWNEEDLIGKIRQIEKNIVLSDVNEQNFKCLPEDLYVAENVYSFPLKYIDGITYVDVDNYTTMYKGEDLKEKHEYILDKSRNVFFKLDDIKYVFEKGE